MDPWSHLSGFCTDMIFHHSLKIQKPKNDNKTLNLICRLKYLGTCLHRV
jgi:hypothetical protein